MHRGAWGTSTVAVKLIVSAGLGGDAVKELERRDIVTAGVAKNVLGCILHSDLACGGAHHQNQFSLKHHAP